MIFGPRKLLPALYAIRDALGALVDAVHGLNTPTRVDSELEQRVAALELEMERRHAEAEGLLLKAQGKFAAARAAEERERRLAESRERAEEGDEGQLDALLEQLAQSEEGGVSGVDEGLGEGSPVQPVQSAMGHRLASKISAYEMKWARGR